MLETMKQEHQNAEKSECKQKGSDLYYVLNSCQFQGSLMIVRSTHPSFSPTHPMFGFGNTISLNGDLYVKFV